MFVILRLIMNSFLNKSDKPHKHITIEDIRKVKGYEHLSDAEAEKILFTLKQYVSVLIDFVSKNKEV